MNKQKNAVFDYVRIAMALLVIAIHTGPLTSFNETADFVLTRVIARLAVPYFFMLTGYFAVGSNIDKSRIISFLKKALILYLIATLLYLPLNIYSGYFKQPNVITDILRDLLFTGTAYHLWYFPAVMLGVLIVVFLKRWLSERICLLLCGTLYLIGLFGDSYHGLISSLDGASAVYQFIISIFGYTRNGLFFAPLFILLGSSLREKKQRRPTAHLAAFIAFSIAMTAEALLVRGFKLPFHDSMYLFLPAASYFLFLFLKDYNTGNRPAVRNTASYMYILHLWAIIFVRALLKIPFLTYLLGNSLIFYITTSIVTIFASCVIALLEKRLNPKQANPKSRAWAELNLGHLEHNVARLKSILPSQTEFMAVIKANAYGHGDVLIAKHLNKVGVHSFGVATLQEGIRLRKSNIKGTILILGYTPAESVGLIRRYRLTQTVCDFEHAQALDSMHKTIDVHVKIDTGMHRLGTSLENFEQLTQIYNMKHLTVTGTFSHLSAADQQDEAAKNKTIQQIMRFSDILNQLESRDISVGKRHIQNSYGCVNYPDLRLDIARIGILLYGVDSDTHLRGVEQLSLRPVLSLKSRVASIKEVLNGEHIGYGLEHCVEKKLRIATISIGYADGLPRDCGEGVATVLINGQLCPTIGRVCMDQMMVDITNCSNVSVGDEAIIFGTDRSNRILCEELAARCGTISNEILSRLSSRLERVAV